MRVKVGDTWFEPGPGVPVMIEMNESDRSNIANMSPEATRYAIFERDDMTPEQASAWMDDGAMNPVDAAQRKDHSE